MKPNTPRFLTLTLSAVCLFAAGAPAAEKKAAAADKKPAAEKPAPESKKAGESSEKPAMAEKLDKLLRFPGDYSQVCDAMLSTSPAPIPAFYSIMHGEAGFSVANMDYMRKNRAGILAAVKVKLASADLLKKPKKQPKDPSIPKEDQDVEPRGVDPSSFNTLLIGIVEELDGVEVLPELLAVEEKYFALLEAAEKDPKAAVPQADGSEGAGVYAEFLKENEEYDKLSKKRLAEVERLQDVFRAQAVHRDMLAVCVHIMRKAGYEPMLNSSVEKAYGKGLKEEFATDEELSKFKSAADIPEESREYIKFDPIHKLAYRVNPNVRIPFTPEVRKEILDITKSFIASKNAPAKKEP